MKYCWHDALTHPWWLIVQSCCWKIWCHQIRLPTPVKWRIIWAPYNITSHWLSKVSSLLLNLFSIPFSSSYHIQQSSTSYALRVLRYFYLYFIIIFFFWCAFSLLLWFLWFFQDYLIAKYFYWPFISFNIITLYCFMTVEWSSWLNDLFLYRNSVKTLLFYITKSCVVIHVIIPENHGFSALVSLIFIIRSLKTLHRSDFIIVV